MIQQPEELPAEQLAHSTRIQVLSGAQFHRICQQCWFKEYSIYRLYRHIIIMHPSAVNYTMKLSLPSNQINTYINNR